MSLRELEDELSRLQMERAETLAEMVESDRKIAEWAQRMSTEKPGTAGYMKAKRAKEAAIDKKTQIQSKLVGYKARIHMQAVNVDRAKREEGAYWGVAERSPLHVNGTVETPKVLVPDYEKKLLEMVNGMSDIHDRYAAFAKDPTRINSMRHMASEVARDIAALLKGKKS